MTIDAASDCAIAPAVAEEVLPAAKLHVLGLGPLKRKLGPKWEKLSGLVHKLFEKSIGGVQGTGDFFIRLDELSYAVTFRTLSLMEAELICAAIAKEVCEHLFGDDVDEVSVRAIVAEIVAPSNKDAAQIGAQIEEVVERSGQETVVTRSAGPDSSKEVRTLTENRGAPTSPMHVISATQSRCHRMGLKLGLFPQWDLRSGLSSSLFLSPYVERGGKIANGKPFIDSEAQTELEIDQLRAASAYANRLQGENKLCAISVGVKYESLCCLNSRIRYITALQKLRVSSGNPLLVRIEQIPEGAPEGRLGELAAMVSSNNVRVVLEFSALTALRSAGVRLGIAGIGGRLPATADTLILKRSIENVAAFAASQKAFAYLDNLDTPEMAKLATQMNIRFGAGMALGNVPISGLENAPHFPLHSATIFV